MHFVSYTTQEIARRLNHIWRSKMGTPSSSRVIEYVDLALKALEIVCRKMGLQLRVWLTGVDK